MFFFRFYFDCFQLHLLTAAEQRLPSKRSRHITHVADTDVFIQSSNIVNISIIITENGGNFQALMKEGQKPRERRTYEDTSPTKKKPVSSVKFQCAPSARTFL